jgi:hypothetical protein
VFQACERFGIPPAVFDTYTIRHQYELLAFHLLRDQEDREMNGAID